MGLGKAKTGKLLYHLTALNNLPSIFEHGLMPRKALLLMSFSDVADPDIIAERERKKLNTYTPFYFHPYSSFDVAVKSQHTDKDFVYICIKRDFAIHSKFKILTAHPLSKDPDPELWDYNV